MNKRVNNKVTLINTNRMKPAIAPLGLESLAQSLRDKKLAPEILDLSWEKAPLKAIEKHIKKHRPRAVGVTVRNLDDCYYASRAFLLPPLRRYVEAVRKNTRAPVVLGGVGFSISPGAVLYYLAADYGIRGDGERSAPKLFRALVSGRRPEGFPGLVTPDSPDPEPAMDGLHKSTYLRRGVLDLFRYFNLGGQGNIETLRGCNRKCIYCADPVAKGRRVRFRGPESVAQEMKGLLAMGVHTFHLCDTEFNLTRAHAQAVCRAIIKEGLPGKISFYTYALPKPMDNDLAKLMARAGCKGIDFSVDAADRGMLENLGRDFTPADLEKCARACKKAGIRFMYDLLLGGPGETKKTMQRTITRIKRIRPHKVGVSFGVRVMPGTALHRTIKNQGPLHQNPSLRGALKNNPGLIKPVFYLSEQMGPHPESYLKKIINDHPAFLFASSREFDKNYNYNNNRMLISAIRRGGRGAFWDIIPG